MIPLYSARLPRMRWPPRGRWMDPQNAISAVSRATFRFPTCALNFSHCRRTHQYTLPSGRVVLGRIQFCAPNHTSSVARSAPRPSTPRHPSSSISQHHPNHTLAHASLSHTHRAFQSNPHVSNFSRHYQKRPTLSTSSLPANAPSPTPSPRRPRVSMSPVPTPPPLLLNHHPLTWSFLISACTPLERYLSA